ncbi:MAG: lytic transglycosylase domain-containing protein [Hyphomicrobium sp.]
MTCNLAFMPRLRPGCWRILTAALAAVAIAVSPASAEPAAEGESPKPALLKAETEHIAKLDALLAPSRAYAPSTEDAQRIREAVNAVRTNAMGRFPEIKASITDPVGQKLVEWVRLRSGYGEAGEYRDWLKANPLWPERSMMVQRMEEALFTQGGSAQTIKEFFKTAQPETGLGYAALASAYLAEDNKAEAKKHAAKAWRDLPIPGMLETGFLRRFSDLLDESDHKWRFDRMVTDDVRWAGNRADRAAFAKRVIPLLSADEQKKATARLAVFNKSGNARALIDALPAGDGKDWGLAFHRAQVLRKSGKVDEAAKLILSAPKDPEKIAVLDEWWAERRELAYGALKNGNRKLAYELTKDAGPLTVNPLKEQSFMAGWIAFRYLKNADAAEQHFKDLAKAADGPLSRAKAAYWLARVAESRGDKAAALANYKLAAQNPDTFHGLLSMQKAEPGRNKLTVTPPELPTSEQAAKFNALDAVKAVVMARKAGLSREYTRGFLTSLRIGLPSEAEAGMVAHLAEAIGDTQMSLRIAKSAIAKGQNLLTYGYPVHPFPAYKPLRTPPETAFLLGIARQETEFEPQTVSGAGAKGLLQVMNVTAKEICSKYNFKCEIPRLLTDNTYNVKIASAYIANYMEYFSGSYVLGLAGYNAGPGRARQWIRENGDPRDPKVDIIDWIERIPISETRDYVTKVLSNIQVYRARLGDGDNALRLEEDLARARGNYKMPAETNTNDDAGTAANTEG